MPDRRNLIMADWKLNIKKLAEDFCLSQVKVNRILKRVESMYEQREIPSYYKGKRNNFLYDKAQREIMNLVLA